MKSYKVLSKLNHDNLSYVPGEEIGLDDRAAKSLLNCGVIELLNESEKTTDTDPVNDRGANIDNPDADGEQEPEPEQEQQPAQQEEKPARKSKK